MPLVTILRHALRYYATFGGHASFDSLGGVDAHASVSLGRGQIAHSSSRKRYHHGPATRHKFLPNSFTNTTRTYLYLLIEGLEGGLEAVEGVGGPGGKAEGG